MEHRQNVQNVTEFVLWGSLRASRVRKYYLSCSCLHCDNVEQHTHCHDCDGQLNSGCSYLLLYWLLIFYRCCLFSYSHHRYDYRLNFLLSLLDPTFYRALIWWYQDNTTCGHGLWLLFAHLKTLVLFDNRASMCIYSVAAAVGLGWWVSTCSSPASICLQSSLLWPQCH